MSVERVPSTSQYTIAVIDSVNHGTTVDTAAATLSVSGGVTSNGTLPAILSAGSQISAYLTAPTNGATSLTSHVV